jgi:shikimate kinase
MKKESIVLIGMAGVGKSMIGSVLAEALGYKFTDLDKYIEEKVHDTPQGIINTQGEKALLQLEEKSMYEIDMHRRVIAPGGSIIYMKDLMKYLKRCSILIFLDDRFVNVQKRLKNATNRGIVGYKRKPLQEIYDERRPVYAHYADIIINRENKSPSQVVSEIIRSVENLL